MDKIGFGTINAIVADITDVLQGEIHGLNQAYSNAEGDLPISIAVKVGTSKNGQTAYEVNISYVKDKAKFQRKGEVNEGQMSFFDNVKKGNINFRVTKGKPEAPEDTPTEKEESK
jgi:hypothetical protein